MRFALATVLAVFIGPASAVYAMAATAPRSAADQAFNAGDFDRARALYEADLQHTPTDARLLSRLGELNLYSDRRARAESLFSKALKRNPEDRVARRGLDEAKAREPSSGRFRLEQMNGSVVVPLAAVDPLPVVKVRLNGKRDAYFLIDTGAPAVVVDPALAKELNAGAHGAGMGIFAGGQQAQVQEGELSSVAIGGAKLDHVPVSVVPMEGAPAPPGVHIEGLIGTSFFYRFLTTIDYAHARLVLAPRSASSRFERQAQAKGDAVVAMWLVGDHFLFARASINGRFVGLFNIDTGGEGLGVQLAQSDVEKAGVTLDTAHKSKMARPGGEADTVPFTAPVAVGALERKAVPGMVTLGGDQYGIFPFAVDGTITHEFFRGHNVTFDFVAMKMLIR